MSKDDSKNHRFIKSAYLYDVLYVKGQPPLFEIAQDEMELGAGVHGEAGIAKTKMGTAKEVVKMILDKVSQRLPES